MAPAAPSRSPAMATMPGVCSAPLPTALTTFIGRKAELESLEELLKHRRLLTLTGAGGSGKTRLGVALAARVARSFPDGVAFVELAALSDPDLLPRQIAAALGIPEDGSRPATDSLADALRPRSLLLLLDNCEHLADAAAALADTLLRACPELTLLATSREALGVAGELAWMVPPLRVPDGASTAGATPDELGTFEAIELFLARARDVTSDFRLTESNGAAVAAICRRLDGVPLAIELAAARVKVLPPEQILQRLDNVFGLLTSSSRLALPRHRTLRATIDWSYRLLSEPARVLLQRLSVFSGGCGIEAVESVCAGDGIGELEVLDLLAELVDQSLVHMREHGGVARYSLLEIVRQFAHEALAADPPSEARARGRHAAYFAQMAEPLHAELERRNSLEALARFVLEQDNFRAALHWTLGQGNDPDLAVRITAACWRWWFHASRWSEGAQWCEAVVAACPTRVPSIPWTNALNGAGVFAYLHRDPAVCRARLEEAEVMARVLGDPELLAQILYRLAHLYCDLGERDVARERAGEAERLARETEEPWILAEVLVYATGFVHRLQGRPDAADTAFAEAEALARPSGALMALMEAHTGRAMLALDRGDVAAASAQSCGAFDAARRLGDHWYISRALTIAAAAAAHAGNGDLAARLLGCGAALREAVGTKVFPHEQGFFDSIVAAATRLLPEGAFQRVWNDGAALSLEDAGALVSAAATSHGSGPSAGGTASYGAVMEVATPSTSGAVPAPSGSHAPGLRVRALGPLEVERHGEPHAADTWHYAKPKELLLLLLLHPSGLTREQVGQAMWPGATSAQVKNSFHVTLHHLRRALGGPDWIVHEADRYRFVAHAATEFDVAVFEAEARRLLREANPAEEALRGALALYRGELLDGEVTGRWIEEQRDRLRRLAVDLMLGLGAAMEARQDHMGAAELYRVLVAREELNEEAHRRLMYAWARGGDRVRALQHYQRLVTLLREELDAEPEDETVAVHEALRLANTG
jgi:predicted ATPase/DNA-binding SARP family transcriptional activator